MSEPDNFLSRWSRRKIEAERESSPAAERDSALRSHEQPPHELPQSVRPGESGDPEPNNPSAESAALDSRVRGNERKKDLSDSGKAGKEPEFDLSTLPSIESISAATDVRAFLQKGVPADLARAALRRAWTADPAIRDFIGIAENQYDFATGSDLPGFGSLDVSAEEIRKLVAEVFGETSSALPDVEAAGEKLAQSGPSRPSTDSDPAQPSEDVTDANQEQEAATDPASSVTDSIMGRDKDYAASQHNIAEQQSEAALPRRTHGRALPQ